MIKKPGGNLIGVVMSGGQSSRMGSDKGLLVNGTIKWSEIISELLNSLLVKTVISINESQKEAYAKIFPTNELIIDSVNIKGPVRGLLSVHKVHPSKDLFILACDMIYMKKQTLQQLIDLYQNERDYDFYTYINEQSLEPLCGIYTQKGLSKTSAQLNSSKQSKVSLHDLLSLGKLKTISVKPDQKKDFINLNTPESANNITQSN